MSSRSRYGIPEDDEAAAGFVASLMRHDVPRRPARRSAKPLLKARPPLCLACGGWLVPAMDHSKCRADD